MENGTNSRIPPEVYQFFTNPGGHSLIVRGNAGTGKTTFALQTLEGLSSVQRSFYHSTRVSDLSLLTQFSWLKEAEGRVARSQGDGDEAVGRSGLSGLKGIKGAPVEVPKGGELTVSIGRDMGELEGLYRRIEANLPEKSLVVIDSIDALAEKYGLPCSKLLNTIQHDIVEVYGSNVLFVVENSDTSLDYLGDGVVNLSRSEYNRRRLRELEILKMRGCEIQQPRYIFTLDGGRIQTFGNQRTVPPASRRWAPLPDNEDRLSTGIRDLDEFLGGLEKGSVVLIELGPGVPATVSGALEGSLVANFASQRRGVLWVPLRKASAESARGRLTAALPEEDFDRCVRIPEKSEQLSSSGPYVLPVEGSAAFLDLKWASVEYALSAAQRPFLALLGLDTMQSMYGSDVGDQLMDLLAMVRRDRGLVVVMAPPSSGAGSRLADLATTRLRVDRVDGTVLLYGEEPFTECYSLLLEEKEVGGHVSLTPIS